MEGWIKIHRRIKEHWIWDNEIYLKAWIGILLSVNHEDKKVLIQGELIECKRGQSLLSLAGWAKCFGKKWTIQRIRTFFELLKIDAMIETEGLRKTTRLTVCNYDSYQLLQQASNNQTTSKQQASNNQTTTNKNEEEGIKNEKNEKNFIEQVYSFSDYSKEMLEDFIRYWIEKNKAGKMKWELQKTWETNLRLATWSRNKEKFNIKQNKKNGLNSNF
jgi:hypothetical protein